ncbi:hypothetical protein ABEB36_011163 [Hypothenemus hampei]|uniref:Chitin-binding type-2 domain-containing protein n=1 Tax=Hypothenemus hampei TaxID=57062 RepID=A0ABD1EEG3_HYPHA
MKLVYLYFFVMILGFSVGDELGFKESITNTEMNRRRSAQISKMQAQLIHASEKKKGEETNNVVNRTKVASRAVSALNKPSSEILPVNNGEMRRFGVSSSIKDIPPFKPIPPAAERPSIVKPPNLHPSLTVDPSKVKVMAVVAVPKKKVPVDKVQHNFADRLLSVTNSENDQMLQDFSSSQINVTEANDAALLDELNFIKLLNNKRTTTTTTTSTRRPVTSRYNGSVGKVMNAPKEYYPVGYDKNFDDNFAARVELPETSFYCEQQKHFPGLYADEDLGCMVFHVCALTEEGLIMKSFLCPESTLYDQAILKCNWWFYVDCKNSKNLYDSNIPISKSYQLMKALTFFSAYKKEPGSTDTKKD